MSKRGVSRSTILPLPSSPHWAPSTAMFMKSPILSQPGVKVPRHSHARRRRRCTAAAPRERSQEKRFFIFDIDITARGFLPFYPPWRRDFVAVLGHTSRLVSLDTPRHAREPCSRSPAARAHARARERPPVTVVVGGCGSRPHRAAAAASSATSAAARRSTSTSSACATTPERFYDAVRRRLAVQPADRPTRRPARATPSTRSLAFFMTRARPAAASPATFLLDEFLELRTFESFPGLRRVLQRAGRRHRRQPNPFVLTSRYAAARCGCCVDVDRRASKSIHVRPLTAEDACRTSLGAGTLGRRAGPRRIPCARACARRRPRRLRPRALRASWRSMREQRRRRDADQRARGAARAGRRAGRALPLLLRAAPAPRARLRRAQGHPRHPGGGGAADADRDRAAAATARRARPRTTCRGSRTSIWSSRDRSATASPIRCCACGSACTAAPRAAERGRPRARGACATRCPACRSAEPALAMRRRRRRATRQRATRRARRDQSRLEHRSEIDSREVWDAFRRWPTT